MLSPVYADETYLKELWQKGERAFFEYHCWESHDSSDAELWYHSHQEVVILQEMESDAWEGSTLQERSDSGHPRVYGVMFADGFEGTVTEDELMTSREGFYCDDPPAPRKVSRI